MSKRQWHSDKQQLHWITRAHFWFLSEFGPEWLVELENSAVGGYHPVIKWLECGNYFTGELASDFWARDCLLGADKSCESTEKRDMLHQWLRELKRLCIVSKGILIEELFICEAVTASGGGGKVFFFVKAAFVIYMKLFSVDQNFSQAKPSL